MEKAYNRVGYGSKRQDENQIRFRSTDAVLARKRACILTST